MKKVLIKSIVCSISIISLTTFIPQKVNANMSTIASNTLCLNNDDSSKNNHNGSWIFDENNLNYLSRKQKKEFKNIKEIRDNGKELSEDQKKQLADIKETVLKKKLGDEKFNDFKKLIEKKHSKQNLTEEEQTKLKEYKNIIRSSKNSNRATFKDFLR